MKRTTKSIITQGLLSGLGYAAGMAGFQYYDGKDFSIPRFIFNLVFFGAFIGFITHYNIKKTRERENKE